MGQDDFVPNGTIGLSDPLYFLGVSMTAPGSILHSANVVIMPENGATDSHAQEFLRLIERLAQQYETVRVMAAGKLLNTHEITNVLRVTQAQLKELTDPAAGLLRTIGRIPSNHDYSVMAEEIVRFLRENSVWQEHIVS